MPTHMTKNDITSLQTPKTQRISNRQLVHKNLYIYRQSSAKKLESHKLCKRFFGPFKIVERIGKLMYRLEVSPEL